jgi:hypothetical protein
MPLPDFRPGDLIDAEKLLNYFRELEARIQTLETDRTDSGQVIISTLIPPESEGVRIGQELRILGSNFYYTRGAARVYLNGVERTIKTTSTDSELRIDIPPTMLTGPATLQVTNSFTSVTRSIMILPPQTPLGGNPTVTFLRASPAHFVLGSVSPYTFFYEIDTVGLTRDAVLTVRPFLSVPEWRSSVRIVREDGSERDGVFPMNRGERVTFGVRFLASTPPSPSSITLRLDVTAEDRIWSLGDRTFQDGQDILRSNPAIRLFTPVVSPPENFDDTTNTIRNEARVIIQVEFSAIGDYAIVPESSAASALSTRGWSIDFELTKRTVNVTQALLDAGNGKHDETISLIFTSDATASPSNVEIGYRTTDTKTFEQFRLTR